MSDDKLDIILQKLNIIEERLRKLEYCSNDNKPNFIREVGANVLGDYIFTVLDNNWIRKNNKR